MKYKTYQVSFEGWWAVEEDGVIYASFCRESDAKLFITARQAQAKRLPASISDAMAELHSAGGGFAADHPPVADAMELLESAILAYGAACGAEKWTPCSEKMPEPGTVCLVTRADGFVLKYTFTDGGKWINLIGDVSRRKVLAWRPIPAAYQPARQEKP